MTPITQLSMLKYRAKHHAAVIKEQRARIAESERNVRAAKQAMREINQQISAIYEPTGNKATHVKNEMVADFKSRIAAMVRERETGKRYSDIGASRAASCVVRGPTDRGYAPPERRAA